MTLWLSWRLGRRWIVRYRLLRIGGRR